MWLLLVALLALLLIRLIYLVLSTYKNKRNNVKLEKAKTLIVLGSGGHTTEMLALIKKLNPTNYNPRCYVVADIDSASVDKLKTIEQNQDYEVFQITRSRKVKQSYMSSIVTTIVSILNCMPLLYKIQPDLILCNGPATCVPVCYVAFLLKLFFINRHCKITFVESFCRVKTLSLSGWLLLPIVDIFVVQWPKISKISSKIVYFGRLM